MLDAFGDMAASDSSPSFGTFTKSELQEEMGRFARIVEDRFLEGLMKRFDGNVSRAARASGIHRSHLQKMLARRRQRP